MELVTNPGLSTQVLELLKQEYEQEKPLPHLVEVIYCLTRSYYDRIDPILPNEREVLLFSLGWGLERLLLKEQRKAVAGVLEGINYSPDFIAFTDLPAELKTTRMSVNRIKVAADLPITWQRQILGYMKCMGTTEYELAVLYLMGNYRPPFPQIVSYRLSASQAEIDDNWRWIQTRKTIFLNAVEMKVVPPAPLFAESWECQNCRYSIRCEVAGSKETFDVLS